MHLYKVNPAYTSIIGKYKYSDAKKLNIHVSASYVIARRSMGLKDKVPKKLKNLLSAEQERKHHWSQWNVIGKTL